MARKALVYKFTQPAGGSATASFRAECGTCEAGGTVLKENVLTVTFDGAKYAALSAGEKTAIGALKVSDLVSAAFHAKTEV